MTVPSEWQFFGKHKARVEGDIVYSVWDGPTSLAEVQAHHAVVERVLAERGQVYSLVDVRSSQSPSPEVRQWLAEQSKGYKVAAFALFGASFTMRTLATLMWRAGRILTRDETEIGFFETEAEARAFLAAARAGPTSSRVPRR
jgi:hypothetical protein